MIEENGGGDNAADLLNIGHMHWIKQDFSKATKYYKKCYQLAGEDTFREMMLSDADSLLLMDVPPMDVPLILDLVRVNSYE